MGFIRQRCPGCNKIRIDNDFHTNGRGGKNLLCQYCMNIEWDTALQDRSSSWSWDNTEPTICENCLEYVAAKFFFHTFAGRQQPFCMRCEAQVLQKCNICKHKKQLNKFNISHVNDNYRTKTCQSCIKVKQKRKRKQSHIVSDGYKKGRDVRAEIINRRITRDLQNPLFKSSKITRLEPSLFVFSNFVQTIDFDSPIPIPANQEFDIWINPNRPISAKEEFNFWFENGTRGFALVTPYEDSQSLDYVSGEN